jgi:putative transposase
VSQPAGFRRTLRLAVGFDERLNREIKRRSNVARIFPKDASIIRIVGALVLEQNDEWAVRCRYMSLETMAGLCDQHQVTTAIPAV